jgi:uncharacterized oligopeptide transporter (OPT) family protein
MNSGADHSSLVTLTVPVLTGIQAGLYLPAAAFVLVFLGLALPAVWSRKAWRRKAAIDVLHQILGFFRRGSSPQ